MKKEFLILIAFWISTTAFGQIGNHQKTKEHKATAEIGTFVVDGDRIPYWLRTNQHGIVPLEGPIGTIRVGISSEYQKTQNLSNGYVSKKGKSKSGAQWDWGYGLDLVTNLGATNEFIVAQGYVKGRYGPFEIWGGRKREVHGLVDTLLTSGSYAWSGNALPIPKIQIEIPEFTYLKFTKNLIAVRGFYAHGWFEQDRFVKNAKLHQKAFYGRIGKPDWKVKLYGGFNHQVQWGGNTPLSFFGAINGQLPDTFKDYLDVVLGFKSETREEDPNYSYVDQTNRIGNHLGSLDLGVDIELGQQKQLSLYRQNVYEDGSLYFLTNISDGLNGISYKNPQGGILANLNFEYISTKSQGGAVFDPNGGDKARGLDNYFNHGQYLGGWSYHIYTIGTPLITPNALLKKDLNPGNRRIGNNRIDAFHVAVAGNVNKKLQYLSKITLSKNFGSYARPFLEEPRQLSIFTQIQAQTKLIGGSAVLASIAYDNRGIYPSAFGFYLGLRKTGSFFK